VDFRRHLTQPEKGEQAMSGIVGTLRGRGLRAGFIGFILGAIFWATVASATRSVEVTFYKSPTPTVWCYLSETNSWVECIEDPCEGDRARAERLRGEAEQAKRETEAAQREAELTKHQLRLLRLQRQ
jgi:hypothetical protein